MWQKINSEQCPTDAPDFICAPCHLDRLDNDEEWLEQTEARRVQRIIHEGSNPSVTPVDVVADAEEKVAEEAALASSSKSVLKIGMSMTMIC